MAALAISGAAASAASSPADDWITPQEQLNRLALFAAEEQLHAENSKFKQMLRSVGNGLEASALADSVTESAARSILKHSHLSRPTNEVPKLTDLAVEHLIDPTPLSLNLTNWYVARERLGRLPEKMPPLPHNISQILNGKCPIYDTRRKPDRTHYRVGDTHVLQLLCAEDGNLDQFEDFARPYGEGHYGGTNPLRLRYFLNSNAAAQQEHRRAPFEPTHWDLSTRNVLPRSRMQPFTTPSGQGQSGMIRSLSKKAFVKYELPSLKNISRTVFLHKVATDESLYAIDNKENIYIYTRLEEKLDDCHLDFGGFSSSGAGVTFASDIDHVLIGVAARRKFPRPLAICPSSSVKASRT